MSEIQKRPLVIRDLIQIATYLAQDNLDASDRFLGAVEETFKQLAQMPQIGKLSDFSHPSLVDVRQQAVKGFRKYLVFYRPMEKGVEILRIIHGARDVEALLEEELGENN